MANFALNCFNLVQDAVKRERFSQEIRDAQLPGFSGFRMTDRSRRIQSR